MKIWLIVSDGQRRTLHEPHEDADHAIADGACPKCDAVPCGVQGSGRRTSADDRAWEADGYCTACKQHVGIIRVEPNTLFGVREDEAVLMGRCRVY